MHTPQTLVSQSRNGDSKSVTLRPGNSLVEVLVWRDPDVTAGGVTIQRVASDQSGNVARVTVAILNYAAAVQRWQGEIPPGSELTATVSSYAATGGGSIFATASEWSRYG